MKRHRLGQHYLVDQVLIHRIIAFAEITPTERVLEIGTGKGALTKELAGLGKSLVGYEVDGQNFAETTEAVWGTRARILRADAFEQKPEFDVLVASLPYSESASFVEWLSTMEFDRAVVLLQEDFAKKILAPPGDRNYRGVSALVQIAFDAKILERVKRESFAPQPRVNSVIVSFMPRRRLSKGEGLSIMRLFSLRRRRVDSALAELGIKAHGSQGTRRVNSLRPEEVYEICRLPGPE
ncbi:MAG: hypothetical protein KGI38_01810 [Thaumarchaeota archaeon]|nr:hypothetical protein [Nitrososphaerota archaeon]